MPRRMAFPAQISFSAVHRSWEKTLMAVFNVAGDARRTFDVLRRGGTAVVPHTIGYAALGGSGLAVRRIFEAHSLR